MSGVKWGRMTWAESRERPVLDFVLPGLLSGSVGLIVGQGAVGKSMLALSIGLAVATGRKVAGGLWTPGGVGSVVIVAGEDSTQILQERMYWLRQAEKIDDIEAADIDTRMEVLSGVGVDLRVVTRSGELGPFYAELLRLCDGRRLAVLDSLVLLFDADENDNAAMTCVMRALVGIAQATGCTIVLLHHVSKSGAGDREAWTAARGASAITTAARWQVSLSPPSKDDLAELGIAADLRRYWVRVAMDKVNYGETPAPQWLRRERGGVLVAAEPPPKTQTTPPPANGSFVLPEGNRSRLALLYGGADEGHDDADF
ncbi:MAG: helicase RepA family protein [Sinobacteraceae bacterium]|nr:helicase RepA family protein [Nevskiaceae bacterium]